MSQIRTTAEIIYSEEGRDYSKVNCSHPQISPFCQEIKEPTGMEPVIHSSVNAYCAYTKLKDSRYCCVDSQGRLLSTEIDPSQEGYCNGIIFVCPEPE